MMKTRLQSLLVVAALLSQLSCEAPAPDDEVRMRKSERKRNGRVVRTSEAFTRNGKRVLLTVRTLDESGHWKTTRSYDVNASTSFSETDEDGDGHFEMLLIFDGRDKSLEAFQRLKDGTATPVSPTELKLLRDQYRDLSKSFNE